MFHKFTPLKHYMILFFAILVSNYCLTFGKIMAKNQVKQWPVLKHYDQDHINKIAMPIGGIGTGTVSLSGRGNLQDWEIVNRPAKGFNPGPVRNQWQFFSIYSECKWQKDHRLREGTEPLYENERFAGNVKTVNHGMPGFENSTFDAA